MLNRFLMDKIQIWMCLLCYTPLFLVGQFTSGGGGPAAYFLHPVTPREAGLGGLSVTTSTGVFASFYNPASIGIPFKATMMSLGAASNYTSEYHNKYNKSPFLESWNKDGDQFIGLGMLLQKSDSVSVGFQYHFRKVTGFTETYFNNDEIIEKGDFYSGENLFVLSGALGNQSLGMCLGVNAKLWQTFVSGTDEGYNAKNYIGFDVGFLSLPFSAFGLDAWKTGTVISYFGSEEITDFSFKSGISTSFLILGNTMILIESSFRLGKYTSPEVSIGTEISMNKIFFLYAGLSAYKYFTPYESYYAMQNTSIGMGFVFALFQLDLSYTYYRWDNVVELLQSPLRIQISSHFINH